MKCWLIGLVDRLFNGWLVGWLVRVNGLIGLIDWLADWSDWLIDWYICRLIDGVIDWLVGGSGLLIWLMNWWTDWLIDCLIGWLFDWLIGWLVGWLIGWLIRIGEPGQWYWVVCCSSVSHWKGYSRWEDKCSGCKVFKVQGVLFLKNFSYFSLKINHLPIFAQTTMIFKKIYTPDLISLYPVPSLHSHAH